MSNDIQAGDKAPAFSMPATGGGKIALKDFKGEKLVMFFYPKDMTPGCTTESKEFSAKKASFTRAGAKVLGVSKDSLARHEKFVEKEGLKIPLASDADSDVIERYGSWILKKLYGREYMGIDRSTFLIDEKGVVQQIWRKVKVKGHVDEVLEAVKALK
ncbi:MAG: thioredoxin-dependent thiol peroxidase [Alphaproteobacteria bacterium]|nr:MAG: thioredoxin-dependent thiol peroxidase [Alphaproteobacteria bacterium]